MIVLLMQSAIKMDSINLHQASAYETSIINAKNVFKKCTYLISTNILMHHSNALS